MTVNIKDIEAYQKELRNDYIINKELSNLAGNLSLKCGRFRAKHLDFNTHLEKSAEATLEEIPQQSSTTAEELLTNPQ